MSEEQIPAGTQPPPQGVGAAGKAAMLATLQLLSTVGKSVAATTTVVVARSKTTSQQLLTIIQGLFKGEPMAMKRCPSGHYFDPAKTATCPLCAPGANAGDSSAKVASMQIGGGSSTQTQGFMVREHGIDPTVGWVVCIKGPERGKDFRIRSERNVIGRSPQMHIAINDDSISRDNHASIVFTPIKSVFRIHPGESRGLAYLNGEEVLKPEELKQGDRIMLGATELLFVPLAGKNFNWEEA